MPWFSKALKSHDMAHGPGEGSLPQLTRGETGDNREDVQAPCDAGDDSFIRLINQLIYKLIIIKISLNLIFCISDPY